ncbi:MAG: DUF805 domain-containing protein [Victivallaceae bacterium]|nr:DUF805 domain-containing protein [Victivallaceae bacterium]
MTNQTTGKGERNELVSGCVKYAVFDGRTRRKEYWFFVLFNVIISLVLGFVDGLLSSSGIIGVIYGFAVLIPSIAVSVRRLHDINRSGWWLLIGLIPLIGTIVMLIFMVTDGTTGDNQYGADPKTAS